MVFQGFRAGDSYTGLLVDGVDGTPFVGASLSLDPDRGVILTVPFMNSEGDGNSGRQFGIVREWFLPGAVPTNMLFVSQRAEFTLFDVGFARLVNNLRVAEGTLRVGVAVAGLRAENVPLQKPLELKHLYSEIKGLYEWSGITGANWTPETDDAGRVQRLRGALETVEPRTWQQGQAAMTLNNKWTASTQAQGLHAPERTVLRSSFPTPQPLSAHLLEHRKFQAFLVMMSGKSAPFAKHQLEDESFARWRADGSVADRPSRDVIVSATFTEHQRLHPIEKGATGFIASISKIDVAGLERWASNYEDWRRFILPAVGLLARQGIFVEDKVSSLAMSLEAAGHAIGKVEGEEKTYGHKNKKTTATWFFRCFAHLGWDFSALADSSIGLARAVASNYNDIKHADRGDFPRFEETSLVAEVLELTARSIALKLAEPDAGQTLEQSQLYRRLISKFDGYHLHVNGHGKWVQVNP